MFVMWVNDLVKIYKKLILVIDAPQQSIKTLIYLRYKLHQCYAN